MKLSTIRLFPLALALALALLSFWLERTVREEQVHPSLRRHEPDFFAENFAVAKYNAAGAKESSLAAAKMIHYPDDDSTELVAPRVEQMKPDQPRLTVTADRGALSQNGDDVFLYDNVLLVREAGPQRPEARIRTSFLHVVTEPAIVRTDREVTYTEPARSLTGRGMEYHNDTQELYLRDRVLGRLEPVPRDRSTR